MCPFTRTEGARSALWVTAVPSGKAWSAALRPVRPLALHAQGTLWHPPPAVLMRPTERAHEHSIPGEGTKSLPPPCTLFARMDPASWDSCVAVPAGRLACSSRCASSAVRAAWGRVSCGARRCMCVCVCVCLCACECAYECVCV